MKTINLEHLDHDVVSAGIKDQNLRLAFTVLAKHVNAALTGKLSAPPNERHAFVRGEFLPGTRGHQMPDETCAVCGRDPRNTIHDVKRATDDRLREMVASGNRAVAAGIDYMLDSVSSRGLGEMAEELLAAREALATVLRLTEEAEAAMSARLAGAPAAPSVLCARLREAVGTAGTVARHGLRVALDRVASTRRERNAERARVEAWMRAEGKASMLVQAGQAPMWREYDAACGRFQEAIAALDAALAAGVND